MSEGLDVIIIDDEEEVCSVITETIAKFYSWGEILTFTDIDEAAHYCLTCRNGIMIFILDVFVGDKNGFAFLDAIEERFPSACNDTIMITGKASDDVVNMCVAQDVNYLLEKPVKPYALQLAVRSIVNKYLTFAKRLLKDADFARSVSRV